MLKVNLKNAFIDDELCEKQSFVEKAKQTLINKTGAGNDFLGWLDWSVNYDKDEFIRIKKAAKKIQETSDCLVVVGIGGSYLGSKAVISALQSYFPSQKQIEIIFAGHTLSSTYHQELLTYLKDKDFSVNVISKSGTTTEPAIAFRLLKELLVEKYGKDASSRIYATTDLVKGALRTQANELGYETFNVPDNIGGRYSVFTAVGLLPIACAGIDIDALLLGAHQAQNDCYQLPTLKNPAMLYALARFILEKKGKTTEVMVTYEPNLSYLSEWWKQLFGESEGKEGKGIFPSSVVFSTDLHSLGQYLQDGKRILFETVLNVIKPHRNIVLTKALSNLDELNYLAGKTLHDVNQKAMQGTILAHVDGKVPNIVIELAELDAYHLGYLLYFYMFSCGLSCYMQEVNPFNQPGVESYKKNMFALLGKPGFEKLKSELEKR